MPSSSSPPSSQPPPPSAGPPSSTSKITAFRFSDEELAMLEMIQGHTGIKSRTEALRAVLEYYIKEKSLSGQGAPQGEPPPPEKPKG